MLAGLTRMTVQKQIGNQGLEARIVNRRYSLVVVSNVEIA
jgi:hypothetical protein